MGLDILGHVVSNMMQNVRDERSELQLPDFFKKMVERQRRLGSEIDKQRVKVEKETTGDDEPEDNPMKKDKDKKDKDKP